MPHETEITEDIEGEGVHGVHIKLRTTNMPYRIATFDGDERVSEWKAALQKEDEIWFAEGYLKGKENYQEEQSQLTERGEA